MQCKRRLCPHRKYVMYDGILGTPSNFCVPSKWLKTPKLSKTSAVIPCICWKQGVPSWCDNPPTCKKYAPVLHRKTPCMFWPSLLVCAASIWFFSWVLQCVVYNFAWFCLHFCIVFPDWMVWREVCAFLVCPHLQDVCTRLVWKAPCMCWPSLLVCAAHFPWFFSWVLESSSVSSTTILHGSAFISRLNGPERGVCHLSVPPFCKKVVLRRYASFFWNWRAWMCHLSVSWQPPKKCLATQKRLTPCWFLMWSNRFWGSAVHFSQCKGGKTQPSKR